MTTLSIQILVSSDFTLQMLLLLKLHFENTVHWLTRVLLHVLPSTFNLPMSTFHFDRIFPLTIVNLLFAKKRPEAVLFTSHISKCCRKHTVGG